MEKAGKSQATQESSEFQSKIATLAATHKAFLNLQKVGKSIFTSHKKASDEEITVQNPADAFIVEIKETIALRKSYEKKRLAMDTAKSRAHAAAEKAKVPGKNEDANEKNAEKLKEEETTKIAEYAAAKDQLLQSINTLCSRRDDQFNQSITAMCDILNSLTPDWALSDESKFDAPSPVAQSANLDDAKEDVLDDAPEGGAVSVEAPNTTNATDSESD